MLEMRAKNPLWIMHKSAHDFLGQILILEATTMAFLLSACEAFQRATEVVQSGWC